MKYKVVRNYSYDYSGQSSKTLYPNLHKYPATMLPQIGIDILREFQISNGSLLDPYCGTSSSFIAGLECGLTNMEGYDINPLAVLISQVKFTKVVIEDLLVARQKLRNSIFEFLKNDDNIQKIEIPTITNINFWFSKEVINNLTIIKYFIDKINNKEIRNFLLLPFSETVRECSWTRNNEFKLYRMKSEDILHFNPDVIGIYFKYLDEILFYYKHLYLPLLVDNVRINIQNRSFKKSSRKFFDVVLTSPPYGDSRTTVAYGQFSTLSNEWLDIRFARKIDEMLMGGTKQTNLISEGIVADCIVEIDKIDKKRALEVSAYYIDLTNSIKEVADSVSKGGKTIYIVGNRTVKNVQLPTDQFIAEQFEKNGFHHIITYQRALSNKSMPSKNSPTNKIGETVNTMLYEYIIVCEKII